MEEEKEVSPLEEVRKRLYASAPIQKVHDIPLPPQTPKPPETWKGELPVAKAKKRIPFSVAFLGFALGFFALAGIVASVVLFLGGRSVSADLLEIQIEGPATVSGGESVPLLITVRNLNPTAAEGATLKLDFPEGTLDGGESGAPLPHVSIPLGDIPSGGTVNETIRATFYGSERERITIPVQVEYTTGKSNATFIATKSFGFVLATSPVSLSVTTLSEVSSGQPLVISVRARSNATSILPDVAVSADYPFGFVPTKETPELVNGIFRLEALEPGEEKEIRIEGTLSGQEGDERAFTFAVGSLTESGDLTTTYSLEQALVTIAKPFLTVGLSLNREETATVIAKPGERISALVSWINALSTSVRDGTIIVRISGDAVDPESIDTTDGFYRSSDRTISFDKQTNSSLALLDPQDSGNGSFVFSSKEGSALGVLRNPTIQLSVSVSGERVGENSVSETVEATLTRTVKIESDLSLSVRSVRTQGPFTNKGPWPPVADTESTYTLLLSANNSVNTVASPTVSFTLPVYVRFTGIADPAKGVTYTEATRTVVWNLGELAPGASKSAAIQVALLPSTSQQGTSPLLTSRITITGHDRFTDTDLQSTVDAVSTETTSDPQYQVGNGTVK